MDSGFGVIALETLAARNYWTIPEEDGWLMPAEGEVGISA
jgi:hypothetical protein